MSTDEKLLAIFREEAGERLDGMVDTLLGAFPWVRLWAPSGPDLRRHLSPRRSTATATVYRVEQDGTAVDFAELLYHISLLSPELRIRYSTSHPKDCSDALLHVHRERPTVCDFIHLPVQHGNTDVLQRMRRTYTREQYLELIDRARAIVSGIAFSTDLIAGFCSETEAEHADTLSLMEAVRYDHAFMFAYSERPHTYAARKYADDVPEEVKKRRNNDLLAIQSGISRADHQRIVALGHSACGYSSVVAG